MYVHRCGQTRIVGGAANFAWPDETYFTRVKEELSAKGIH